MMAQFGNVCASIDENVNNRVRIHHAPVQHSAADTSGTSTQSYRPSVVRCRRRKAPESETPNGDVLCRLASRSVGNLSSGSADEVGVRVFPIGTLAPRVDTPGAAHHHMIRLNGYHSRPIDHCQDAADVHNANGNAVLTRTSVKLLPETDQGKRISDGWIHYNSNRTLTGRSSNVATCGSNTAGDEDSTNGVPLFEYSHSDAAGKGCEARNKRTLRTRSAIEYRVPDNSVNETSLNGFAAIEYPSGDRTSPVSDARNEKQIVPRSGADGALAKAGDFDREREIERRMRELGLWEYKRAQERHLAELLDAQITQRDGLTAAIHRCRRRHRGEAASAADDIRSHVNHHFIRDAWGRKVAYDVRILMGCFTRDVAYMTSDNVVTVHGMTSDPGITLNKEMTIELPDGVDSEDVTVTYTAGVVRIRAPFSRRRRNLARSAARSLGSSSESSNSVSST